MAKPDKPETTPEVLGNSGSKPPEGWLSRKDVALKFKISYMGVRKQELAGHLTPFECRATNGTVTYHYDPSEVEALAAARDAKMKAREASEPSPEEQISDDDDAPEGKGKAPTEKPIARELALSHLMTAIIGGLKQSQGHAAQLMSQFQGTLTGMQSMMASLSDANIKVLGALTTENESLRKRYVQAEEKLFDLMDIFQKSLDREHERKIEEANAVESRKLKTEAVEKLLSYAPLLAALVGSKYAPGNNALKEAALVDIVRKMTPEQVHALMQSGALDQAGVATVLALKQRLIDEEVAKLRREAESEGVSVEGTHPAPEVDPGTNGQGS